MFFETDTLPLWYVFDATTGRSLNIPAPKYHAGKISRVHFKEKGP